MKCGRAEHWVIGHYRVKYANEPQPVKKAMLGVVHCKKDAVVAVPWDGMVFRWCEEHANEPICGVPKELVDRIMMNEKLTRAAAITRKHATFIRLDKERNILIDTVAEIFADEPGFDADEFRAACQPEMLKG